METSVHAAEFRQRWRARLAYLLLSAVLALLVALPVASVPRGRPIASDAVGILELFSAQLVLAVFLAAWFLLQQRARLRAFFALPSGDWSARFARGVRLGVLGWLLTLAAMAVFTTLARAAGVEPAPGFKELAGWMATRPLALRVALILSAMTVEEAFFRAFLQPRLGVIPATACFALSHLSYGSPAMGGGVFVLGLVLARAFERQRDLAVCVVAHGVFDAIQLLVVLPLVAAPL